MSINVVDIIQHVLNIIVLYVILRALVYKPVRSFMKKREDMLEKQRSDIEAEKQDILLLKSQYEQSQENAKAEAEKTVYEGVQRADKTAKEIVEKAEAQARTLVREAREQSLREKQEVMTGLKGEVTGISIELALKILEREVSAEDNQKIIDEYFRKVG